MKVALLQLDIFWEDRERNFDRVSSLAADAKAKGAELLSLTELFSTGYTMNSDSFAEELDGPTPKFLSELAREKELHVIGSFIEKTGGKPRNSAVVYDPGGNIIGHYSKMYLPGFLKEDLHYQRGSRISVFKIGGVKMSLAICYDLRFPELFRAMMERGVNGVFVIASWPVERIAHWDILLKARAVENQFFVFGVNRVGETPVARYAGHSMVIDPAGNVVARAEDDREEILIADIDFDIVDEIRERLPVLNDRIRNSHSQ